MSFDVPPVDLRSDEKWAVPVTHAQMQRTDEAARSALHSAPSFSSFPVFNSLAAKEIAWCVMNFAIDNNIPALRVMKAQNVSIDPKICSQAMIAALQKGYLDCAAELMSEGVEDEARGWLVISAVQADRLDLIETWLPNASAIPPDFLASAKRQAAGHPAILAYFQRLDLVAPIPVKGSCCALL
jgi:hypothetical protein